MARFAANPKTAPAPAAPVTTNRAGGKAYEKTLKQELATIALSSVHKDAHHESAKAEHDRVKAVVAELAKDGELLFAAQAAVYARREHGLRTISHIIAGEVGRHCQGLSWSRAFFNAVVVRPDDMTEMVSYYLGTYGKRLPNAMTRGFAQAFARFDEYALAKYQGNGETTLVDVVNLVHPIGDKQSPVGKLVHGKLPTPETWETGLSAAGDDPEAKAATWRKLLQEDRLGYIAAIRNLRNIAEQAPKALDDALAIITDPEKVKKARIFPFAFSRAFKAVNESALKADRKAKITTALNTAVELSCSNIPEFGGTSAVVVDVSPSMGGPYHMGKDVVPSEIAAVFAAALVKASPNTDLLVFGGYAEPFAVSRKQSLLDIAKLLQAKSIGSTNFHCIFPALTKKYDRVFVLSDGDGWVGAGTPEQTRKEYEKRFSIKPIVYYFDLAGNGTTQFAPDRVCQIAGWSDKVFDIVAAYERGDDTLVKDIAATHFDIPVSKKGPKPARTKAERAAKEHVRQRRAKAPKARSKRATARRK